MNRINELLDLPGAKHGIIDAVIEQSRRENEANHRRNVAWILISVGIVLCSFVIGAVLMTVR